MHKLLQVNDGLFSIFFQVAQLIIELQQRKKREYLTDEVRSQSMLSRALNPYTNPYSM